MVCVGQLWAEGMDQNTGIEVNDVMGLSNATLVVDEEPLLKTLGPIWFSDSQNFQLFPSPRNPGSKVLLR